MNASVENIGGKGGKCSRLAILEEWRQEDEADIKKPIGANRSRVLVRPCRDAAGGISKSHYEDVSFGSVGELSEAGISGLVIDNPDQVHVGWIVSALKHGIPVFCGRPPILKSRDAHRLADTARKHDCLLAIDFVCRHIKGMSELRDHIRRGELGRIDALDITFRLGQGHLKNVLPEISNFKALRFHLVDLAMWLFDYPRVMDKEFFPLEDFEFSYETGGRQEHILAKLCLANGPLVRLAYSKRKSSRDAVIDMGIYGDCGDGSYASCNDTLFRFTVGHSLASSRAGSDHAPRDRTLNEWLEYLYFLPRYDPAIESFVYLTELLSPETENGFKAFP